jgi:hypothetical protein
MRRAVVLTSVVVLAVGLAVIGAGWLTRDREYVAVTPQPESPAVVRSIQLEPDSRACMNLVALDRRSEQARFRPAAAGPRAMPIELTLSGPGYFARGRLPADYRDAEVVSVPVTPPPRSLSARACFHNLGSRTVGLVAVHDRTRSRSGVLLDGKPIVEAPVLAFYERRPVSILDRLPDSMRRMSVLRPGVIAPVTLWPLLALFVVGVPAAALWAFARAVRSDERS